MIVASVNQRAPWFPSASHLLNTLCTVCLCIVQRMFGTKSDALAKFTSTNSERLFTISSQIGMVQKLSLSHFGISDEIHCAVHISFTKLVLNKSEKCKRRLYIFTVFQFLADFPFYLLFHKDQWRDFPDLTETHKIQFWIRIMWKNRKFC